MEPEPWIPGTTSHTGLAISLDADNPSLDSFWEGNVGVSILGPAGHQVSCVVRLESANGKELFSEQIGTFDLPVTPNEWFKKFQLFVKDDRRTWTYLEATSGRFIVRGDELGEYALRLERDVKPVRWATRNAHRVTIVRLIDDTGGEDAPVCRFHSFTNPASPSILSPDVVMAGLEVQAPGGIFEAVHGKFRDAINVSIPPTGLDGLQVKPDLRCLENDAFSITDVLEILNLWTETRLLGPLIDIRRNRVIDRLVNRLFRRLCGQAWADAEAAFLLNHRALFERHKLEDTVGGPRSFSSVLGREYDLMEAGTASGKHWFAGVASRYQVSTDTGLCEFALQLASRPHELLKYPRPILDGLLLEIKEKNVILRGARLVALFAASNNPGPFDGVFPRWKW